MPYLLDAIVILGYFSLIIGIGLSQRSKSGSVEGFTLGDRQIAWWAVLASILAAEISAGTFFGAPGEGYALRNYTYIQLIVGYLLARVVVSAVFIPAYYRHNVVSIYEFLGQRFGPRTRRLTSAVFLVTRTLASGTRLWVPSMLLVLLWHLQYPGEVLSPTKEFLLTGGALIFVTLATALYTSIGGIRAVIWTDVIQIIVLICALGFSLNYLLGHIPGGWAGATKLLTGDKDLLFWDWGFKPGAGAWGNIKGILEQEYTVWAAFLGSTFVTLATHGTDQDMVQRMLTAKNKKQSAMATILSGLADVPITLVVLAIGILLWVYYQQNPDGTLPRSESGIVSANKVFPHFIRRSPRHRHGISEHGAQRPGHQLRSRFPLPLVRRARDRCRPRSRAALWHRALCRTAHLRGPGHCLGHLTQSHPAHPSHHPRYLWLHLRLIARRLHGGPVHPHARQ